MRPDRNSWIITAVVFVIAAAFTIFMGYTITRLSGTKSAGSGGSSQEEARQTDEVPSDEPSGNSASTEPDSESASESEPSSQDTSEGIDPLSPSPSGQEPSEEYSNPVDEAGLYNDGVIKTLGPDTLSVIEANFSTEEKSYWIDPARDELSRPSGNMALNAEFIEKFGEGSCRIIAPSEAICLSFVLVTEYDMNTSMILDALQEAGIHAVFYIASGYAVENPGIIERILNEGHELGSIGAQQDASFASLSLDSQMEEARRVQEYIYNTYQYRISKFFYSFNSYSDASIELLREMGYTVCFYSGTYDDLNPDTVLNSDEFLSSLLEQLHPGMITLLHTTNSATLVMLPSFIQEVQARGYHFGTF